MSRARLFETIIDAGGSPIVGASVAVYEPNTTTPIAETLYADDIGGTTLSNPLATGADGSVLFYLDLPRRVDLYITAAGQTPRTVPDFGVMPDPATLAPRASGQAVGSTSSPTTTSTTYVDLPEMSVTLAPAGTVLIAELTTMIGHNTLAAATYLAFSLNGAAEVGEMLENQPVAGFICDRNNRWRFSGLSPGTSYTIKARWKVSAGTATAWTIMRTLIVHEG